jgi:hypothetical protein
MMDDDDDDDDDEQTRVVFLVDKTGAHLYH